MTEKPLWHRIYFDPVYTAVARAVGYAGCTYRCLAEIIEDLANQFDKRAVESAIYFLVTLEGLMTCNPKPLADVKLRAEARILYWQLLGPPPEKQEEFNQPSLPPPPLRGPDALPEKPSASPKEMRTRKKAS